MKNWLSKPYPFLYESITVRLQVALAITIFVFLFLSVFQPFNLANTIKINLYLGALVYGLTSAVTLIIYSNLVFKLFPNYFLDKNWTIGREMINMIYILLAISLGNGVLGYYIELCPVDQMNTTWFAIYRNLIHTFTIGIFPVLALTSISYIIFLKRNLTNAALINQELDTRQKQVCEDVNPEITIISTTNNNDLTLKLNDLLYVMSDGNYVEFHLEFGNEVKREIRRNTLSNIESQLETYQFLFRSHRAYLVNLKKVIHSSGNAQGYELKFKSTEQTVPVSRRNLNRFAELIKS